MITRARATLAVALGLLLSVHHVTAESLVFKEHNFSIELPNDWVQSRSVVSGVVLAANKPDRSLQMTVAVHKPYLKKELMEALNPQVVTRDWTAVVPIAGKSFFWMHIAHGDLIVGDKQFAFMSAKEPSLNVSNVIYITETRDAAYTISFTQKGLTPNDPDISRLLHTFKLLSTDPNYIANVAISYHDATATPTPAIPPAASDRQSTHFSFFVHAPPLRIWLIVSGCLFTTTIAAISLYLKLRR